MTHHLPPASQATARAVDRGWNGADDDRARLWDEEGMRRGLKRQTRADKGGMARWRGWTRADEMMRGTRADETMRGMRADEGGKGGMRGRGVATKRGRQRRTRNNTPPAPSLTSNCSGVERGWNSNDNEGTDNNNDRP